MKARDRKSTTAYIKRAWSKMLKTRALSGHQFIKDLVTAIGLTAFLMAADYFTDRASVHVGWSLLTHDYTRTVVDDFFRDNEIDPPAILTSGPLEYILQESDSLPDLIKHDWYSHVDYIRYLQSDSVKPKIDAIDSRCRDLEEGLSASHYSIPGRHFSYLGRSWGDSQVQEILDFVRSRSTALDYYVVLSALLYSRTYRQDFVVYNDGDLDLRNIQITVPAPISRLTRTRDRNIIHFQAGDEVLNEFEQQLDRTTLRIPILKVGQRYFFTVWSRENQLNDSDLTYTYQSDRELDSWKIALWLLILLAMQWAIRFWFRGSAR